MQKSALGDRSWVSRHMLPGAVPEPPSVSESERRHGVGAGLRGGEVAGRCEALGPQGRLAASMCDLMALVMNRRVLSGSRAWAWRWSYSTL